jgi:hypothetical protein
MSPGSALFYLGSLWHGGGANRTSRPRLGVILEYAASWLRPQENHCLAVPRDVARNLPERLQELLGYNIYPPFVGYVDGHHPRRVLSLSVPRSWTSASIGPGGTPFRRGALTLLAGCRTGRPRRVPQAGPAGSRGPARPGPP